MCKRKNTITKKSLFLSSLKTISLKSLHLFSLLCLFTLVNVLQAQTPFVEYGLKAEMLTLSSGKYDEYFIEDSIVLIGSVLFNTNTNRIVAFIQNDTAYSEATLKPEIFSRWLSPDPLAAKYPYFTPYSFAANNPIIFIDPDGKDVFLYSHICQSGCDENNMQTTQTWNSVVGLTNTNTIEAMKAFLSTPEGYAYVAQYAKAGTDILGFKFTENGALSNHDLVFNDIVGYDKSGALGETSYSLTYDNVNVLYNRGVITRGTDAMPIGSSPITESMLADKVISDDPMAESYQTARITTTITLWDANTQPVAEKAITIGHEAFIHSEMKSTPAIMAMLKGNYRLAAALLNRKTGENGDIDHKNYAGNPGLFKTFEKYSQSLGNTTLGGKNTSYAIKKHDAKYDVKRN